MVEIDVQCQTSFCHPSFEVTDRAEKTTLEVWQTLASPSVHGKITEDFTPDMRQISLIVTKHDALWSPVFFTIAHFGRLI